MNEAEPPWRVQERLKREEWNKERAEKLVAMDPKQVERARTFLDTLMVVTSPNDMVLIMFCVRAAFSRGGSASDVAHVISELANKLEHERFDAEDAKREAGEQP